MRHYDYIILGAGASGLLMAYRMASDAFFDSASVLIIDKNANKRNDRTWSFWEQGEGEWEDIVHKSWDTIYFGSDWFSKTIPLNGYAYKTIRSEDFYLKVQRILDTKSNIEILYDTVTKLNEKNDLIQVKTEKSSFTCFKVLNSIDYKLYVDQHKYPVLNQHFLGWFVTTKAECFDDSLATFMDFKIPQNNNTRFMYVLPFSKTEALFEYTLFSKDLLEKSEYENGIKSYLKKEGITDFEIIEKEYGVIPMTSYKFNKNNSKNILNIGTSGGWTKASTGFTFMNSIKKSKELIEYIKQDSDFRNFAKSSRFWFYDLILLDVLAKDNAFGAKLFSSMFQKTDVKTILKFLDEESNIYEELKVILSVPPKRFIKAFLRRVF